MKNLNNIIGKLRGSVTSRTNQEEKETSELEEEIAELDYSSKEHKQIRKMHAKL